MKRLSLSLILSLILSLLLAYSIALADSPIVGEVRAWAGPNTKLPAGWVKCDGAAISRSTYSALFTEIGTTYGAGDGSTMFNVPNLNGKNIVSFYSGDSKFDQVGEGGGEQVHTLTVAEMPGHNHSASNYIVDGSQFYTGSSNRPVVSTTGSRWPIATIPPSGGDQPHNVLDPYLVMTYIIYTGVGGPTPTPTATPLATYTPAPTYTPAATYTPVPPAPTYTPWPTYTPEPPAPTYTPGPTYTPASYTGTLYLPNLTASYTHTLRSGKTLSEPVEVTFGQLIVATLGLALVGALALPFVFGVVFKR